jgi:uncharacterized lipoprotein
MVRMMFAGVLVVLLLSACGAPSSSQPVEDGLPQVTVYKPPT